MTPAELLVVTSWFVPLLYLVALVYLAVLATRFVRAAERLARSHEETTRAQREIAEALETLAFRRSQT